MKFGFRKPSFRKSIAARSSLKRLVRHSLGLKAPRGWGWFTNPKQAAYSRVYNRTSFGALRGGSRSSNGAGCLIIVVLFFLVGFAVEYWPILAASVGLFVAYQIVTRVVARSREKREANQREEWIARENVLRNEDEVREAAAEAARAAQDAAFRKECEAQEVAARIVRAEREAALFQLRLQNLTERFGTDVAAAIVVGRPWQGATADMLIEALGHPAEIKERVLKTKVKHQYCYRPLGRKRYALKVHLENGIVVGWDAV